MNLARHQLRARPFPTTPDAQFYYPATVHESALNAIAQAIEDQEGLALLTGETGTGKTLLGHLLLARLGADLNTALLVNCRFASTADLLRSVLYDLGQPHQGMQEQELRIAVTDYVLGQFKEGRRTVLVLDEAQDLTPALLEEVRLLGNLESGRGKAIQVVLIGLPPVRETLQRPELAALNQRLAVRADVLPLDLHESADYVLHQVRVAGGRPGQLFTDEAILIIAKSAAGIPRLINRYAAHAMTLAEKLGVETVDVEVALESLAGQGVEAAIAEEEFPTRPLLASNLNDEKDDDERVMADMPSPAVSAAPGSPSPRFAGAFALHLPNVTDGQR